MTESKINKFVSEIRIISAIIIILLVFGFSVKAQENTKPESNTNQAASSPSPTPTPVPTPIPISDVITEAGATAKKLEKIQNDINASPSISVIEADLPKLKTELDSTILETTNLLAARPSLETLRVVEQHWKGLAKNIPVWKDDLKTQVTALDNYLKELQNLRDLWNNTLKTLNKSPVNNQSEQNTNTNTENINTNTQTEIITETVPQIPAEILQKINEIFRSIQKTEKQVEIQRGQLLTLQTRVSKEETRINETLASIMEVRTEALTHLFIKDSPAIWNASRSTDTVGGIFMEAGDSYATQFNALREYAGRRSDGFIIHGLIFLLFTGILFWARKRLRPMVKEEPELETAFSVFRLPIIGALILSIMLSSFFYPQAPRMLSAILGAAALIPGIIYLRQILEKPLFPVLNALVIFYFIDQLRQVTATLPLLSRFLFIAEMLGAIIFLVWFLRSKRLSSKIEVKHQRIFIIIKKAIPYLLGLFTIALVANLLVFVSLSNVIGNSVLGSSYIALILYTAVQIIKSLLTFAFRVRPLSELGMVKNYPDLLERKIFKVLKWLAIIFWVILTLNLLSVRQTLFKYLKEWLTAELVIGSIAISLSDIIIFAFTVWLAFALSRVIRFVLQEDIYPRVNLGGGIPYAISTVLHYVILVVGFVLAIAALGVDLTKFTILAGAFGVGLGFGLQNIVNNFVSGLILLFERPVKVNDVVQIGTHQGDLKSIGLRASVLRTLDGAEVIVPNGQLISEEVTNWTFSDQQRRLDVNVGVAYGSNPRQIMDLLTKVGLDNEEILDEPPPRTIFVGFGNNSLDFQFRAWTDRDSWVVIKSDLTLAVHDILTEAGIEIPFPQRDLHLRSVDKEIIEKNGKRKTEN
ncbi:MAG: mechanosensitive ion channel family protein [Aridibacter sp.]